MKRSNILISLVIMLLFAMIAAGCGKNNADNNASQAGTNASTAPESTESAAEPVKITLLESKGGDVTKLLADAGKEFTKANPNITVEVMSAGGGESPYERAATLYAAGTPATLAMLDAGDIVKFKDKAADLSGEKWVADLAQPNQIDGKTIAFPFSVEGYGFIYNKSVLDKAVGGTFDPATINTTSALEELFKKIQASGPAPLLIGSMDWSLGNHFLALAYAAQPDGDVDKYLGGLKSGSVKLADDAAYNGLLQTFDVMKKYNKGKNDPLSVTYEQSAAAVAKGEAGITFNGNWMISDLQKSNPTGEFGFIPVPVSNNANDKANSSIAIGATKQIFIDNTVSTEEQQAAAKKFLNWIVYEQAGQDFLVNKANVIPAFKNIQLEPKDSLAKSIKAYNNAGNSIPFAGNYVPGDHWKVLGASMQKYLVNKDDQVALAAEIEDYWKNVK